MPKHTGKAILFLIFAAIVLALSGCTLKKNPADNNSALLPGQDTNVPIIDLNGPSAIDIVDQPKINEISPQIDKCMQESTKLKVDTCIIGLAKGNKLDYPCEKITYLSKDRCFYDIAAIINRESTCGKIANVALKNECFDNIAVLFKDAGHCAEISDTQKRDLCYKEVGALNKDEAVCGKIFDQTKRDACYIEVAGLAKDDSFCEKVGARYSGEGYARDNCYYAANAKLEGEKCFKLIDKGRMETCFREAENVPDPGVNCKTIADSGIRNACIAWHAVKTEDIQECKTLPYAEISPCIDKILAGIPSAEKCRYVTDYNGQNLCYYNAAVDSESDAPCGQISGEPILKDLCYANLAGITGDVRSCTRIRINNFQARDECYSDAALEKRDPAICEYVKADESYYMCFEAIAEEMGLPDICSKMKKERLIILPYPPAEYCYLEYALNKDDRTICPFITTPNIRNSCYIYMGATANEIEFCNYVTQSSKEDCIDAIRQAKDGLKTFNCIIDFPVDGSGRNNCYKEYAIDADDSKLCYYIKDFADKIGCITTVDGTSS